jgi:hypothetical protein
VSDRTILRLVRLGCVVAAFLSLGALVWLFGDGTIFFASVYAFSVAMLVSSADLENEMSS